MTIRIPEMSALIFRNATPEDLPKIVEIYNSTIPTRMVTADTGPVTVESRKKWFEDHNPGKRPLWVVENPDHSIIGWVSFQSFYGRPAYNATAEVSLYLDENYRGKGIGKEVMKYCLEKAPLLGIKTLLGFIFEHNEPSLKLLEKFGFETWGFLPRVAVLDGQEKGLKILGKRIAT